MIEFETTLLREKFVIHDTKADAKAGKAMIVALSNRMVLEFKDAKGSLSERFIVRAQNMHSCVRMAARILHSVIQSGPILSRAIEFDWPAAWDSIVNDYEHSFNPQRWVAIYSNGRLLFSQGEHHPFLDVIESCDARNDGPYDEAVPIAEKAFLQTGKSVRIDYDANVALVVHLEGKQGRCGIIMRGPTRTTTFNFKLAPKMERFLNYPQALSGSAAFLEAIQIAFMVGMNNEKIRYGIIERHSHEEKQTREARRRLTRLTAEIENMEKAMEVRYRPEKPDFQHIVVDAEALAQKLFAPQD